jgi:hypothetical protein
MTRLRSWTNFTSISGIRDTWSVVSCPHCGRAIVIEHTPLNYPQAVHERARAVGAEIVYPLTDEEWGLRRFLRARSERRRDQRHRTRLEISQVRPRLRERTVARAAVGGNRNSVVTEGISYCWPRPADRVRR